MYVTYNDNISSKEREEMGLPVHSTQRTPPPPITHRPRVEVLFSQLQRHSLVVTDSELITHGRPPRVAGFEVWRKMGDPAPHTDTDWQLVVQAPRSPHLLIYSDEDARQRVYYRVRWVNSRGESGPWSETVSAIIN
jgi:hypothetical protein